MLFAAKSHIGLVRPMNQDNYVVLPQLFPRQACVVADGMGGPSAGEIASQIAIEKVSEYLLEHQTEDMDAEELLREAVHVANQHIYLTGKNNPAYFGMGTTIVCALLQPQSLHIAHVGDSRAYLYHAGILEQITADHSLVAELVRRGQLTEDEAKHHPQRHLVTRSLGAEEHHYPDVRTLSWATGDTLLLCTDGLFNLVEENELLQAMEEASKLVDSKDLDDIATQLIQTALSRGGSDNITLVLAVNRKGGERP